MSVSVTSPRGILALVLKIVGSLLVIFGAGTLLFTAYLVAVERSLSLGHVPAIAPAAQGLILLLVGVFAFRMGRKLNDTPAS
jgi:hypothetical protein